MSYLRPYHYYDSFSKPVLNTSGVRASAWSEFIPVEQKYIDYEPQHRIDYIPVEKTALDYVEI